MVQTQTERTPQVGDEAPDFTLPDADQNKVSLHDLRGETVVLAFFPAAFSGTCTKEMCAFRDSLAQFNQAKAQVLESASIFPLRCGSSRKRTASTSPS